ncbi:hypothetical protein ACTFIY_008720 [Dictyostelium cf. discoideum]
MPIHSDNKNLNNGSFHLYCDVSDKATSGVLYQIQGDKLLWFHGRKLTDTQKRYSIGDREFLSIIDSLKKFQHLLIEFDYELRHISGKKNGIADFLSRIHDIFQWDESFLNKIKEEQINSQWLLEMKRNPNLCIEEINDICYLSEDGFKKLIIIDKETIHTIIREYHDTKYSGHHALDITYNNIRLITISKKCFLLSKEVDQVCVIVCRLSKMVHIVPCHKTIDAEHTAQLLLNHVFQLHGYPRTIVSYRDPRFLSEIWSRWANTMDSKLKMNVAHRAQADGQTERTNREIIRILTKASTEYGENWSDIIPLIEFAMNSSMSKSTKMSPFQIAYGFNPPTPVNHFNSLTKTRIPISNIKKIVRDNILDAQINAQKYYNRGRGDVIFVNCGPFIITAIHGNNVTLDLVGYPKKHNVFNKDQIVKLYEDTEWLREEISMSEPEEMDEASFEVQSILNHDKVKKMYLVKFKGYPEPEWIKEVDTDCEELVRESSQPSQPITPRNQKLTNTNRNNQSKKRKYGNQSTSSDDEPDLSLQITTTRSGRKVTPKRL